MVPTSFVTVPAATMPTLRGVTPSPSWSLPVHKSNQPGITPLRMTRSLGPLALGTGDLDWMIDQFNITLLLPTKAVSIAHPGMHRHRQQFIRRFNARRDPTHMHVGYADLINWWVMCRHAFLSAQTPAERAGRALAVPAVSHAYKLSRILSGLPARGQSTRSCARTARLLYRPEFTVLTRLTGFVRARASRFRTTSQIQQAINRRERRQLLVKVARRIGSAQPTRVRAAAKAQNKKASRPKRPAKAPEKKSV